MMCCDRIRGEKARGALITELIVSRIDRSVQFRGMSREFQLPSGSGLCAPAGRRMGRRLRFMTGFAEIQD
jgi:hypothetical protein